MFAVLISYAQNFEDVILWRALKHVDQGFYIDIGAQDPVVDSVSLSFYEHGWLGVHVEPTPVYADALRAARPDETVVQAAIGADGELIAFFEIAGTGISTGDADIARKHEADGFAPKRIEVPCIKLASLLDVYANRDIHWMKIDVEGMELAVLSSWHPSAVRPWIVVVEATLPLSQVLSHCSWEPVILGLGYSFVYFDGLNRFYVSSEHIELCSAFSAPPNVFDNFALSGQSSHSFCKLPIERAATTHSELEQARTRQAEIEASLSSLLSSSAVREAELTSQIVAMDGQAAADASLVASLERQISDQRLREERSELMIRAQVRSTDLTSQQLAQANHQVRELLRQIEAINASHVEELSGALQVVRDRNSALDDLKAQLDAARQELIASREELFRQRQSLDLEIVTMQRESLERQQYLMERAHTSWEVATLQSTESARASATVILAAQAAHREQKQALLRSIDLLEKQLKAGSSAARSKADSLHADVELMRTALEQTHSSFSWRLTAPLRWLSPKPLRYEIDAGTANISPETPSLAAIGAEIREPGKPELTALSTSPSSPRPPFERLTQSPIAMENESTQGVAMNGHRPMSKPAKDLDELLSFWDESFVRSAYVSILHRPVDPSGFAHYIGLVRQGVARERLIVELAESPEGKACTRQLPGLKEALGSTSAIRALGGRALRRMGWTFQRPITIQLGRIENSLHRMFAENFGRFDRLDSELMQIKQSLLRQPSLITVPAGSGHGVPPVEEPFLTDRQIALRQKTPKAVIGELSKVVAGSEEAFLLSR